MRPETLYAKSGDVHIAYQVFGNGPINSGPCSGLRVAHRDLLGPSRFSAVDASSSQLRPRGNVRQARDGPLRPRSEFPSFDLRMDDARAVMDAAGMERAAILGISEGGSMAALFAATYPQRCQGLVIYGGFARASWTTARGTGALSSDISKNPGAAATICRCSRRRV